MKIPTALLAFLVSTCACVADLGEQQQDLASLDGATFYYKRTGPMVIGGAPVNPTCGPTDAPEHMQQTFYGKQGGYVGELGDGRRGWCDESGTSTDPLRWLSCWYEADTVSITTDLLDDTMPGILITPTCWQIYTVSSAWAP